MTVKGYGGGLRRVKYDNDVRVRIQRLRIRMRSNVRFDVYTSIESLCSRRVCKGVCTSCFGAARPHLP